MKRFKIIGLLAVLGMVGFTGSAGAQHPDCTGQGDNLVGLYWSNNEFNIDSSVGAIQTGTLILFNFTGTSVSGWEMRLDYPQANAFILSSTFFGNGTSFGTPPDFIVGVGTPLIPDVSGAVTLASFQIEPMVGTQLDFFATPVSVTPSIPGEMAVDAGGVIIPMYPIGGAGEPIANINGPALDYCSGAANQPPVAYDDFGATQRNVGTPINLVANDTDPDSALDFSSLVLGPTTSGGSVSDNGDGSVNYMPGYFTYEDTFTYTIADVEGAVSNTATVFVSVTQPYGPIVTPDCIGEGQNMLGIVWENNEFSMPNAPDSQTIYGRVYVFNPSGGTVDGFAFALDYASFGSSFAVNPVMPYAGTFIDGMDPGTFSYMLDEPLYPDANGAVPVAELQVDLGTASGVNIFSNPAIVITFPVHEELFTGGDPVSVDLNPLGDDVTPIGSLNGDDLSYCQINGDTPDSAVIIASLPFSDTGSTDGYSNFWDEVCPYAGSTAPDVWYTFTPAADALIDVDLFGSSYDTKTYILDSSMTVVACNDDFYPDYVSKIEGASLTGGSTYFIAVDGYGSDFGAYVINVTLNVPPEPCVLTCGGMPEGEPPLGPGYVDAYNGGCNSGLGDLFQDLVADEYGNLTFCGVSGWSDTGRDTDWFTATIGSTGIVSWTVEAEQGTSFYVLGPEDCANVGVIESASVLPCEPYEFTLTGSPGEVVWLWAGAVDFTRPSGFEGYEYNYVMTFSGLGTSSGNQAPVITGLGPITALLTTPQYNLPLNDYVTDDQPISELTWEVTGNDDYNVAIVDGTASIQPKLNAWFGSNVLTFTATDSGGLTASADFTMTWSSSFQTFVEIVLDGEDSFYAGASYPGTEEFDHRYDQLISSEQPSLVFEEPPGMENYAYIRNTFHDYSSDIVGASYVDDAPYRVFYNEYTAVPIGEFCFYECIWNENTEQYDCGNDCQYEIEGGKFYSLIWTPGGPWADISVIEETDQVWLRTDTRPIYDATSEVESWNFQVESANNGTSPITRTLQFNPSFAEGDSIDLKVYDATLGVLVDLWPTGEYAYEIPSMTAEVRSFTLFIGTPGDTGDTDGDGVPDDVDECPGEDASFFDRDGDGCIDPVIGGRHIEYWADGSFPLAYYIYEDGAPGISDDSDFAAIQDGFTAWTEVIGSEITVDYLGWTDNPIANAYDGINTVTFDDDEYPFPSGVIAVGLSTSYAEADHANNIRPGQIIDTDMIFNPLMTYRTDTAGPADGTYLKGVVTHEAGHMLGLSHSGVQSSTMFYVLPSGTEAASLEDEDRQAVFKAYYEQASYVGTSHLQGTVTDGLTGQPISGAIVYVMTAAANDTVASDFTLPADGSFHFIGLPDGSYNLAIHPLNGSSAIGYLYPDNINALIKGTADILFEAEYWDAGESNSDDPAAFDPVVVSAGATAEAHFITNIDITGPTIIAVSPASTATNVPIDSAILFRCDEAIDPGSLVGNFNFQAAAGGDFLLGGATLVENGTVLAYTPTVNLDFNTEYLLEVGAGLKDLYGNTMGTDFSTTFTTEDQPPVAMNNLIPRKGVAGSILVINGAGFSGEPAGNIVTYGGVSWSVMEDAPSQLVVQVPDDALPSTANVQVQRVDSGLFSNPLSYTVLPPGEEAHGLETAAVDLFALPRQVEVSPDGDFVYIATDQGLSYVDVGDPSSPVYAALTLGNGLNDLDVTPDGLRVYAISSIDRLLHRIDTQSASSLGDISLDFLPRGVLVDPSGQQAYLVTDYNEIQIWDIDEGSLHFLNQIGTLTAPNSNLLGTMATDPAGNVLLALDGSGRLLVFDLKTYELLAEVTVLGAARDVAVDPLGERAYITDDTGNVSIVSLSSFEKFLDIPTGGALLGSAIDPMGSFLYAVNHQLDNLDVIDLRQESPTYRTISARLPQQTNPVDVALSPDGLYAYVIVESDQRLVINTVGAGPMLASLSRRSGPTGATVVMSGLDFTGATVSFNGTSAVIQRADDTSLTVAVPDGATSGPVMILGAEPGEVSNAIEYQVLDASPAGSLRLASTAQPVDLPAFTGAISTASNDRVLAIGGQDGRIQLLDIDPASLNFNQFIGQTDALAGPVDDVVVAPDGLSVFAVSSAVSDVALYNINPGSASFGGLLTAVNLDTAAPSHLAVSPDGRYVLACDPVGQMIHVVNWADATSLAINVGANPGQMAFHPAGLYAFVVAAGNLTVLNLTPGPNFGGIAGSAVVSGVAQDLVFGPDGSRCYVLAGPETGAGDRSLVTFDTSNPQAPLELETITITSTAAAMDENLVLSPAGDRVLLNIRDDGLFLVDLGTGSFISQPDIVADDAPVGFGFATDGARVFAAASSDGLVSTFDFNSQQEISIVWGDGQSGEMNQPLSSSLRVRVTDPSTGEGLSQIPVSFNIDTSGDIVTQINVAPKPIQPGKLPSFLPIKSSNHVGLNKGTPDGNKSGGEIVDVAVNIEALPFSDTGNTSDNLDDYDESCPWIEPLSPDVVYSWTADFSGGVAIDLCGSSYDTKVYAYQYTGDPSNPIESGSPWACNDDFYDGTEGCGNYVSLIEDMFVYEGTIYYIVIDGYGGDSGNYNLNITKNYESSPWGYFATDNPEARPTSLTVGTDEFGFAEANWNLGFVSTEQIVDVISVGAVGSPLQFNATAVADPLNLPFTVVESRFAPAIEATDVSITTAIQIAFSRPVYTSYGIADNFFLSADGGVTPLPALMGFASDNTTVSLTPSEVLEYGTVYTVVIGSDIYSDAPFTLLTNPQTFTFTTEPAPLVPTLTGINPPSGPELIPIMISGSGFSSDMGLNEVYFGGVEAPVTSAEPDFILTRVPLGVGTGEVQVQVTVSGQPTNALPFVVLEPTLEGADEVVVRVPTGSATRSATVSPDGATIYAVAPEADLIIPIDLENFTTLPSIPVGDMPWAISSHPDGGLVYVANRMSGDASVIDIDPNSTTYNQTIGSVQVGAQPVDILVTPAGDRVLVANEESQDLAVIDGDPESASFNYVINRVPAGSSVKSVTVTPDGARIYLGTEEGYILIGSVDYGVVRRVPTASGVKSVTVSPDGALLVVLETTGMVNIFDIAEGSPTEDQVVARVPVASGVKSATVSPDGARLYAVMEEGDIINVYALDIGTSVGAIDAPNPRPVVELVLLDTLTAGENPQVVVFDPSGSGRFIVPNAGDNTVSVFDVASEGLLTGRIFADCPEPETPIPGVEVDIYANASGEMIATLVTDDNGAFETPLPAGQYMATMLTPLGFSIEEEERPFELSGGQTTLCEWSLECETIIPNQRRMGWWKRQFAVALGSWGHAQVDGPTLCGYLDNIAGHFNSNSINQVVIYQPPASDECHDKLLAAKQLLNFWGNWGIESRAKQQLLALLLNVSSSRLSLQQVISHDGANVSQAITFCDNLIDDGNPDNDWTAWWVAFRINVGWMVPADTIPISVPNIFYSPVATHFHLDQNYPNPFNPECRIRFGVPRPGHVRLKIFDIGGRLVKTLVDEQLVVGTYIQVWDGRDNRGLPSASGVYFYKMEAGSFVQTRKMLLMK